jgi:hypothetical protein
MYINTFRLLAFIILFAIIIIVEIPFKKIFKDPIIQLYIAVFCIAILMLLDNITGFILTISILILYFRIYTNEIKIKREHENMKDINDEKEEKTLNAKRDTASPTSTASTTSEPHKDSSKGSVCDSGCDKCSMEMPKKKNIFNEMAIDNFVPYITEENLLAAQTNIIDVYNYNLCINNNDIEILDVKRGALCDIQGLQDIPDLGDTKRLRGYDTYNSRLGNLTYDIL